MYEERCVWVERGMNFKNMIVDGPRQSACKDFYADVRKKKYVNQHIKYQLLRISRNELGF